MRVAIMTPVISRTYVLQAELFIFDVQFVLDTELDIALVNGPSNARAAVGIATAVGVFEVYRVGSVANVPSRSDGAFIDDTVGIVTTVT